MNKHKQNIGIIYQSENWVESTIQKRWIYFKQFRFFNKLTPLKKLKRDNSVSQIDPMIKRQNAHQMKSHEYKINKQIRNSEFECPLISQVHLTHHMVLNFPTYCYSIVLVWQLCFCFVPALSFSSSMQESLAIILSSCTLFRAFLEHVGVKRGFGMFFN